MSTTNQDVGQLRQTGLEATTIPRFALEPLLAPGAVIICDEFSQLPTAEADVVLGAVARCPGGQIIFVGDPQQAQPVGAGGLAHYLTSDKGHPPMLTAELSVNRRQSDLVEREALIAYRAGEIQVSQSLRAGCGWEHSPDGAERARHEMARAVTADIARHGTANVVALAVTHGDCEDIADTIRRTLIEQGSISGPYIEGPGWSGARKYQSGDRIVLHAPSASRRAAASQTAPPPRLRGQVPED